MNTAKNLLVFQSVQPIHEVLEDLREKVDPEPLFIWLWQTKNTGGKAFIGSVHGTDFKLRKRPEERHVFTASLKGKIKESATGCIIEVQILKPPAITFLELMMIVVLVLLVFVFGAVGFLVPFSTKEKMIILLIAVFAMGLIILLRSIGLSSYRSECEDLLKFLSSRFENISPSQ